MIDLQENEQIIDEKRRHWFVIVSHTFPLVLAAFVPLLIILVWPSLTGGSQLGKFLATFSEAITPSIIVMLYSVWLWVLWMLFFVNWTNYYLDTLLITNERLVDTEQISLFHREQVSVPLGNIEDITVEVKGLIPSLLDFGNLHIQTAGAQREAVVQKIGKPKEVKRLIIKTYGQEAEE